MDKNVIKNYFEGNYLPFYEKYLPNIKKIGGQEYQALCPFHDDKNPSFNFSNQTGQYYCHGCNKKGNAVHFYAKINTLDTKRDFGKILKGIASDFGIAYEEKKPKIAKIYDYVDSDGTFLFQVVRTDPKGFYQRRLDSKGVWINNLKGVEPVLYNLPEVRKADEVFICEGEKDVHTLMDLGLTATTCPMGALKWKDMYSECLKGKDAILLPHNDNQGREHMTMVGASLKDLVKTIKLIELANLPSKGDITDWIEKFNDKQEAAHELAVLIDKAGLYEPSKKITLENIIITARDFNALELPAKRMFLSPWLTEQSISLISGWRGTGKTWLAMAIVHSISKGQPFGPWQAETSVPCLFLDGEMPAQDILERITELGVDGVYVYSDCYANSLGLPKANLLSETWRSTVKRILITRKIKLWVIDNIGALAHGIDENSKRDWDPINAWLLELRFAGIATIMLHHTNKEGGQRGTSAREDNLDNSIILKRPFDYTPEDGARFIMHFAKARVRTQDLKLIPDMQFQLREDEAGQLTWTWGGIKSENKKEILRLTDEGVKGSDIASLVGVSRPYVTKVQKEAQKDGLLGTNGKLSQSGFSFINED